MIISRDHKDKDTFFSKCCRVRSLSSRSHAPRGDTRPTACERERHRERRFAGMMGACIQDHPPTVVCRKYGGASCNGQHIRCDYDAFCPINQCSLRACLFNSNAAGHYFLLLVSFVHVNEFRPSGVPESAPSFSSFLLTPAFLAPTFALVSC